ncbi:TetR/AcrR family transcriptional regulator [Nocardia sp. NPDC003482]
MADQAIRRRRRGPELERALLDAAWDELVASGYAALTMEAVAARAKTGVAVLYRRWANKDELVRAAIEHQGRTRPVGAPDTGSLRGDLLALIESANAGRAGFAAVVGAALNGLMADTGLTPAQLRVQLIGDRPLWSDEVYRRAHQRGELDLDRVPPDVLALPFDLVRHDLLMTMEPLPPERITAIVDDIFLPLVRGTG